MNFGVLLFGVFFFSDGFSCIHVYIITLMLLLVGVLWYNELAGPVAQLVRARAS